MEIPERQKQEQERTYILQSILALQNQIKHLERLVTQKLQGTPYSVEGLRKKSLDEIANEDLPVRAAWFYITKKHEDLMKHFDELLSYFNPYERMDVVKYLNRKSNG